jgi:hypothetical protein
VGRNLRGGKDHELRYGKGDYWPHTYPLTLSRPLVASLQLCSHSSICLTGWPSDVHFLAGPQPSSEARLSSGTFRAPTSGTKAPGERVLGTAPLEEAYLRREQETVPLEGANFRRLPGTMALWIARIVQLEISGILPELMRACTLRRLGCHLSPLGRSVCRFPSILPHDPLFLGHSRN